MRNYFKGSEHFLVRGWTILVSFIVLCLLSACTLTTSPDALVSPTSLPQAPPTSLPGTAEIFLPYTANQAQTAVSTTTATPSPEPTSSSTPVPEAILRFAVIGDYGLAGQAEQEVATLISSWQPDLIITTGDNNYPNGEASTIDKNIGQYYSEYIYPYRGDFGPGGDENRFYPSLGNHDWSTPGAGPYLEYFTLPGNERYYDFEAGPVHFFVLNSDWREPDGISSQSIQANWLQSTMSTSSAPWQIVYFHAAPYSSGLHGSSDWMRWPFKNWGADAVLAGHDHTYERLQVDGLAYFVNGLGGGARYNFTQVLDSSLVRYNADHGAMLVEASSVQITFQFWSEAGDLVDEYQIEMSPVNAK